MDDKTLQRKMDQITKLANELNAEAQRRYGPQARLFFAESGFHIMDGDELSSDNATDRTDHIRFSSHIVCHMQAGAW